MQSSSTTTTTQYTRTVSGGDGLVNKPATKKGGCCGDACAMAGFEYRADFKDLELEMGVNIDMCVYDDAEAVKMAA